MSERAETCETCRHWLNLPDYVPAWADDGRPTSQFGECRRYPGEAGDGSLMTLPLSGAGDWCGEWAAKPGAVPLPQVPAPGWLPQPDGPGWWWHRDEYAPGRVSLTAARVQILKNGSVRAKGPSGSIHPRHGGTWLRIPEPPPPGEPR